MDPWKRRTDQDFDQEIQSHILLETDRLIGEGLPADEARAAARHTFGNITAAKERFYDSTRILWLDRVRQDFRYGLRRMANNRAFTVVSILTLTLGIGATTTIFSIVDAVVLRRLPYLDSDRLYAIHEILPQPNDPIASVNATHYRTWRSVARSFEDMAVMWGGDVNVTGFGAPERIPAAHVTPSLFPILGVRAELGRTFVHEDDQPGHDRVVIVSHELWTRRFGQASDIIGRTIALDGEPYSVVGVLPRAFTIPKLKYLYERANVAGEPELWMPFGLWNEPMLPGLYGFACIARLKPGVSSAQAVAELNAIQSGAGTQTGHGKPVQTALVPLKEQIVGRSRAALQLMLAAVSLLLVMTCVNLAHLLFARARGRFREMAIRRAVGATRYRLVWQMISESVLLSGLGGLIGTVGAYGVIHAVQRTALFDVPRLDEVTVNGRVLGFTLFLSMVTGLLASALPAWQAAKANPSDSLRTISTKAATRAASRLQWTLVSLQVSLSVICVIACGLLMSSYLTLLAVDRGFQGEDVVATSLNVTHIQYRSPTRRIALAEQLVERARAIPGVRAAGVAGRLPLNGALGGTVLTVEGTNLPILERPMVAILGADSGYFGTMGIPLHQGRIFAAADRGRQVAVVAASVAQLAWPGQDPIGRRFRLGPRSGSAIEVVGVVGDIHGLSLTAAPTLDVYLPYWQSDTSLDNDQVSLVLRTESDGAQSLSHVRAVITTLDPEMPFSSFRTMDEIAHASVGERRVAMNAMMFVAAAVMLLASVGIYGLVSYTAAQRATEIGVRLALGARAWDIHQLVMRDAVAHVGIGLIGGLLVTVPLTALMRTVVFGVGPRDPFTIVVALAVLGGVAALAIYIPTRRAANRHALAALRCE